jgi:hypothetical protein
LDCGKTIINIDESIIEETDCRRRGWSTIGKEAFTEQSQRLGKINIIGGVSNKGDFYYTINIGTNNSEKVWFFILKLCSHLDR